jgi:hypothetical protein
MKKLWILLLLVSPFLWSQEEEDEVLVDLEKMGKEIGLDGYFSVGTTGGNFTLGLKLALLPSGDSTFAFGPSFRMMRAYSSLYGNSASFDIFGAGAFLHVRLFEYLFIGGELEFLNSPYFEINTGKDGKQWIATLFLGGGYSQSFLENRFRVNLGIYYDLVNNLNSPYRPAYQPKKVGPNGQNGALIPILYRVSLFIPLGRRG